MISKAGRVAVLLMSACSGEPAVEEQWAGDWLVQSPEVTCAGAQGEDSLPDRFSFEVVDDGTLSTRTGTWWGVMPYVEGGCTLTWQLDADGVTATLDAEPCAIGQQTPGTYDWLGGTLRREEDHIALTLDAAWSANDGSRGCAYRASARLVRASR